MRHVYIKNGRLIMKNRIIEGLSIEILDGKVVSIGKAIKPRKNSVVIDAKDCFVSPGFIDSHIHGSPDKIFSNEIKYGTTSFVIAESCAPLKTTYKKIDAVKKFQTSSFFGKNILGVRLEGPYISKAKAGAQNPAHIRKPDAKELASIIKRCSPILKIMTLSPEIDGALSLIKLLCKKGVIASIGHSDASKKDAKEAMQLGAAHVTHFFNAMSGKRLDGSGVVAAVLSDGKVTAEVILDMVHVPENIVRLLVKKKNKNKLIIITDSIAAIGMPYRLPNGRPAGSGLTMIGALKNAVRRCGIKIEDAVKMMTANPARLLGAHAKGEIAPGKDADIVVFDKQFNVKLTMINGRIVYQKKGFVCAA